MKNYKINFIFNDEGESLNDIFSKVLLREILIIRKNEKNNITFLSSNKGDKN